jgi:hypothetical protein
MTDLSHAWTLQLSENSKLYTDMALPPWATNVELIGSGAAMLTGVFVLGPEMLVAETAYTAFLAGSSIAGAISNGTAFLIAGSFGLATGQDMKDFAEKSTESFSELAGDELSSSYPQLAPYIKGAEDLNDYVGFLTGDGLEKLSSIAEAIPKLDSIAEDLTAFGHIADPALLTDPSLSNSVDATTPSESSSSNNHNSTQSSTSTTSSTSSGGVYCD